MNALTRRSFWHENRETCKEHNERLEFLGDAVLGLVIADVLYREFPEDEEGELQKKRASLVNRAALAQLMRHLNLAEFIRMGRGDEMSGCRNRDSILADTLEALVAAVYMDGGFREAEKMIRKTLLSSHYAVFHTRWHGRLQERPSGIAQAEFGVTPTYEMVDQWGEEHRKTFSVAVYLGSEMAGLGTGRNKREAAQKAAREALQALQPQFEQGHGQTASGAGLPRRSRAISKPTVSDSSDHRILAVHRTPVAQAYSRTLIKRYKRFIADVRLKNDEVVSAHCPNSGSMLGCSEPGRPVYLSRSDNPTRRLLYTWEMIRMPSSLVGVNTLVPTSW